MGIIKNLCHSIFGMSPKYEFTNEMIQFEGEQLKRIRSLRRFVIDIDGRQVEINPGDLGGFIAIGSYRPNDGEFHLSHKDNSWIGGNAKCCGTSQVAGDSLLTGNAVLAYGARIFKSFVGGNAHVGGSAKIYYSYIFGDSWIKSAEVRYSYIFDKARVDGHADIGNCCIYDNAKINLSGTASSFGIIRIAYARIFGNVEITYPMEHPPLGFGLGLYEKKNVTGGRVDSVKSFEALVRSGKIYDLGREGCVMQTRYGHERIEKVLPLRRNLNIPIQK